MTQGQRQLQLFHPASVSAHCALHIAPSVSALYIVQYTPHANHSLCTIVRYKHTILKTLHYIHHPASLSLILWSDLLHSSAKVSHQKLR